MKRSISNHMCLAAFFPCQFLTVIYAFLSITHIHFEGASEIEKVIELYGFDTNGLMLPRLIRKPFKW